MQDGFRKKVSGSEKFMIAYNELRPPFVIQLTVEGEGEPDPERLFDALEQCTAANPGSSLRFQEVDGEENWVVGPPPTLTVVDAPEFRAESDDDAPFLRWALDARTGPTCELVFVRGAERNYLIFRALHAVMDGQGTLAWAQDFMRCLRGEAPLGHPSPLVVDDLVRDLAKGARPLPGPDALHPFGPAKSDTPGDFHWRRIRVERALDSGAVGRVAVAIADLARRDGEGIVRINLPTDLRHYAPDERSTGNLFSALFLEVPPHAAPEQVGLQVVRMLYKHEGGRRVGVYASDDAGSLAVHKVRVYRDISTMHDTPLYPFSATLSHLGTLSGASLSAEGWSARSALFVPLVGDSGCVMSLNGFDDHTELAVGLSDAFTGEGALDELAATIRGALEPS